MSEDLLGFQDRLLRSLGAAVCMVRSDAGRIEFANPQVERILGYGPEELGGRRLEEIGCAALLERLQAAQGSAFEVEAARRDGTPLWCRASGSLLEHPLYGRVWVVLLEDLTERKHAEVQLRASIEEKEVLLREIHHRVKNNLQVVSSLLSIQARSATDPAVRDLFKENQARVRALALIHEKLYRSQDLAHVDMAEYLESLIQNLVRAIGTPGQAMAIALEVDQVELGVDTAIPVGLIVNELISNSLEHAFPDGHAGEIRVALRRGAARQFVLVQSDDGVGLPETLDPFASRTLGLELVRTLVRQLGGAVAWRRGRGTEVVIEFSDGS